MSAHSLPRLGHLSFLAYLAVFSYLSVTASVGLDLTELRNKVSKIKVNPRGNLWATGHFMGKKSLFDYPNGHDGNAARLPLNSPQGAEDLKDLLTQEMLDAALAQEAEGRRVRYNSVTQYKLTNCPNTQTVFLHTASSKGTGLLMKIIERYVKNSEK